MARIIHEQVVTETFELDVIECLCCGTKLHKVVHGMNSPEHLVRATKEAAKLNGWSEVAGGFESPEQKGMRAFHVLWALTACSWRILSTRVTANPEPGKASRYVSPEPDSDSERYVCGKCWPVFVDFLLEQNWKGLKK